MEFVQANTRIPREIREQIQARAKTMGVTYQALVTHILTDYLERVSADQ